MINTVSRSSEYFCEDIAAYNRMINIFVINAIIYTSYKGLHNNVNRVTLLFPLLWFIFIHKAESNWLGCLQLHTLESRQTSDHYRCMLKSDKFKFSIKLKQICPFSKCSQLNICGYEIVRLIKLLQWWFLTRDVKK